MRLANVAQPPKGRTRWSCRTMAWHSGMSAASVQRLGAAHDLKPHRSRTFKLSNDPNFEAHFRDVVGLCLNPPTRAVILCCYGKSPCQPRERTQPELPLGQGPVATRAHDDYRHGTVTLFGALNYLNGKLLTQRAPGHCHQEWSKFLKAIEADVPADVDIHLILNNSLMHKPPPASCGGWRPGLGFVFTSHATLCLLAQLGGTLLWRPEPERHLPR